MVAYYNEIDPYCVEWLRNLIREGLIADGQVDDRSISDVRPIDLRGFTQCHFFAGLGGWSGALRRAAWPDHRPVWTGSCPCQPFSVAGKQGGFADERHLWPHWRYLIAQCRPAVVYGEQVASASAWLGLVRGDLEALDYAVAAIPVEAASAGADHLRDRYWFVGHSSSAGLALGSFAADERGALWQERASIAAAGDRGGPLANPDSERQSEWTQQHGCSDQPGQPAPCGNDALRCGLADSSSTISEYERAKPSRMSSGAADARAMGNSTGIAERKPHHEGNANADEWQARPISGGSSDRLEWVLGADGKTRRVKSGIRLLAHGVPCRVAKLRALGNAIDLRPTEAFIRATM